MGVGGIQCTLLAQANFARDGERIFKAIVSAANEGRACPSNEELSILIGSYSRSRASNILTSLENEGKIAVVRGNQNRVVTITETGKRTAGTVTKLHWRLRRGGTLLPPAPRVSSLRPVCPAEPKPLPPAIVRDPCQRCGTRADIGCQHLAPSQAGV